jgi:hypothetical protein
VACCFVLGAQRTFPKTPVSGAADPFALGIILYQCLTGALPFPVNRVVALMAAKLEPADGQADWPHNGECRHDLAVRIGASCTSSLSV